MEYSHVQKSRYGITHRVKEGRKKRTKKERTTKKD
jgi:hypothetical protein